MNTPPPRKEDVLKKIKNTKDRIARIDDMEKFGGAVYSFMDAVSRTLLSHQGGSGPGPKSESGWAAQITDKKGRPLWTADQSALIEKGFATVGGQVYTQNKYETTPIVQPATPYDPMSFSVDDIYYNTKKYLDELDEKNKQWASTFGPIAMIKDKKDDYMFGPFPPYMPIAIPVSPRLILPAINTFLETLRVMVTFGPLESGFLRTILSVVTGIFEVFRGEWRNGALSFLGVFNSAFVYIGSIGKIFRLVYGFISPDIQDNLEDNIFEGGKSLFIGVWLWLFSMTAPASIRAKMMEIYNDLAAKIPEFNKKIGEIEAATRASLAPSGMTATFKRLDPGLIPSFDDIQAIQSVLRMPEIQCLDSTREMIAPLLEEPILRLILEFVGFKTSPAEIAKKCTGIPTDFSSAVQEGLVESVGPVKVKGGRRRTRTRRPSTRTRRPSRKSRKNFS